MKWGVRKKVPVAVGNMIARGVSKKMPYVTVIQGRDNARKAAAKARKDTINKINNSPDKKYIKKKKMIRDAEKQARKESIAKDKAFNREHVSKGKRYGIAAAIAGVTATAILAYPAYKVGKAYVTVHNFSTDVYSDLRGGLETVDKRIFK